MIAPLFEFEKEILIQKTRAERFYSIGNEVSYTTKNPEVQNYCTPGRIIKSAVPPALLIKATLHLTRVTCQPSAKGGSEDLLRSVPFIASCRQRFQSVAPSSCCNP